MAKGTICRSEREKEEEISRRKSTRSSRRKTHRIERCFLSSDGDPIGVSDGVRPEDEACDEREGERFSERDEVEEEKRKKEEGLAGVSALDENLKEEIRDDGVRRSIPSRLDAEDFGEGSLEEFEVFVDLLGGPGSKREDGKEREETRRERKRERERKLTRGCDSCEPSRGMRGCDRQRKEL